jgi:hypothetical protein
MTGSCERTRYPARGEGGVRAVVHAVGEGLGAAAAVACARAPGQRATGAEAAIGQRALAVGRARIERRAPVDLAAGKAEDLEIAGGDHHALDLLDEVGAAEHAVVALDGHLGGGVARVRDDDGVLLGGGISAGRDRGVVEIGREELATLVGPVHDRLLAEVHAAGVHAGLADADVAAGLVDPGGSLGVALLRQVADAAPAVRHTRDAPAPLDAHEIPRRAVLRLLGQELAVGHAVVVHVADARLRPFVEAAEAPAVSERRSGRVLAHRVDLDGARRQEAREQRSEESEANRAHETSGGG